MKIESLASRPDMAGRYLTRFSDGSSLRVYRQTLQDFGLYAGMELSDQDYARLQEAHDRMSAKMRSVRIVSASSVSKSDLERRLIRKGEDPVYAREAVAWMSDMELVDDRKTAEQIVHSCAGKGYGINRAKQALYEKRIPKEYWQEALADYPDQTEKIVSFLRSRLGNKWDRQDLNRAIDGARRRGHIFSEIRAAMAQLQVDTEEFPED